MKKHSKMYVEALGNVEKNKEYDVTEAIKILKSLKARKFDESVDLALNLNIDAKKTDMNIRGSFVLPNGTGKTKRVLVITKTKADEAKDAEYVGAEDMLEKIEKENWFEFDIIVATPEMMPALGKLGNDPDIKSKIESGEEFSLWEYDSDTAAIIQEAIAAYNKMLETKKNIKDVTDQINKNENEEKVKVRLDGYQTQADLIGTMLQDESLTAKERNKLLEREKEIKNSILLQNILLAKTQVQLYNNNCR